MRIWSLHPHHLDRQGLIAGWREALLAQAVLLGRTKGYRNHPQLERFTTSPDPVGAIGTYLSGLLTEATSRGYRFNADKIEKVSDIELTVTAEQIAFEQHHLLAKIRERSPSDTERITMLETAIVPHPMFTIVPGPIEAWERGNAPSPVPQRSHETQ